MANAERPIQLSLGYFVSEKSQDRVIIKKPDDRTKEILIKKDTTREQIPPKKPSVKF